MTGPADHENTPSEAKRYRLLMELGKGGMGVVQLAFVRGPEGFVKVVVLKSLRAELVADEEQRRMFLQEARISARLSHLNAVQVYEVTEVEGLPTIVMEYLEGQSLWTLQKSRDLLPLRLSLEVLDGLLAGLHAAHELKDYDGAPLNLVHRDVSPHNVFVLYDGRVKVLDFGIAKATGSEIQTETGILKGKLRYMAPEQFMADEPDRRADLFAVGVMLWEALSRKRFWGDLSDKDVMRGLITHDFPELEPGAHAPELVAVCERALAAEPEDRFTTAEQFRLALLEARTSSGELPEVGELSKFVSSHFEQERRLAEDTLRRRIQMQSVPPGAHLDLGSKNGEQTERFTNTGLTDAGGELGLGYSRRLLTWAVIGTIVATVAAIFFVRQSLFRGGQDAQAVAATPVAQLEGKCGPTEKLCAGRCVSIDRPEFGCGSPSCEPCVVENATPRCDQKHSCDIAVCYQDYDDCDGKRENGCETAIRTDPDHCGGCGRVCEELPHAERGCGDACTVWRCEPGFRDCNLEHEDGCEQDVSGDRNNCGHCGRVCAPEQTCRRGRCI